MDTMDTFETLYGIDIRGKLKEWRIQVIDNGNNSIIKTTFGYCNGALTESIQTITEGKNIGKSNQTTHYDQAISEAKSKWKKKSETGYSCKTETNAEPNAENIVTFPMLAQDYHKHKSKLVYPVYVQQKLDGYRMLYNTRTKFCNSRQGKEFEIIRETDLYKELIGIGGDIILDGELYIHNGVFEHLGILRKKKLSDTDKQRLNQIEYHVYDIVIPDVCYSTRYQKLVELFQNNNFIKIKLVPAKIINTEEELKAEHVGFIQDNYEGSIVRTKDGKYRCHARSADLLKYKDFVDDEFKIVNFTFEKDTSNTNENLIVWVCKTPSGDLFNVRPKGTREERQQLYRRGADFIGMNLYVKYFELTDSKIPRFPTTKSESYTTYIRNIIE